MAEENKAPQVELDTDGVNEQTIELDQKPKDPDPAFEKKEDVEAVIIRTLKDEGGASGLEPLEKATGLSKKELKKKLKEMKKVSLHKNGDYILLEGLPKSRSAFTDRD